MSYVRQLSVKQRAWITMALIFGFYAVALSVAGALLLVPVAEWVTLGVVHIKLGVLCVCASLTVLWAVLPRRDRFEPPGHLLDRESQPRLLAEIDDVAAKMRQAAPSEVYLVPDVNAFVAERGGLMGWGSRRIMGIGLPLLQMLSLTQMRAVLAHEFGHYAGEDTRFGPWLYKVREDMGRTIDTFEPGTPVHAIFSWYGHLFLWVTQAFSREQEYAADLWAATLFGRKAIADGLKQVDWGARCYQLYWSTEVEPILDSGYLPPIGEGFARFGGSSLAERAMEDLTAEPPQADPYDSHPVLQDRLDALLGLPEGDEAPQDPSAMTLLEDPAGLEAALLARIQLPPDVPPLAPMKWQDAGVAIYLPKWKAMFKDQAEALAGVTAGGLPKILDDWGWFIHRFKGLPENLDEDGAQEIAQGVVGAALAVALHKQGWRVSVMPGEYPACDLGGAVILPFEMVRKLMAKELKNSEWKALCAKAGIETLPLAVPPLPQAGEGIRKSESP